MGFDTEESTRRAASHVLSVGLSKIGGHNTTTSCFRLTISCERRNGNKQHLSAVWMQSALNTSHCHYHVG